ncbi:MAG: hypothetical protein GY804_09550 [Alphaproteobacteria bacterium]|nr:hypothetical protein [Alphaproteobacteria bacterium]
MNEVLGEFCKIVRQRSYENKKAMSALKVAGLSGHMFSVLRFELDSMVRVIFLLSETKENRIELINKTINGDKWKLAGRGQITDRIMVDLADELNGWTKSVYKFGCAFIHLSSFHDYSQTDPFSSLSPQESTDIKNHMNYYHGFPNSQDLNMLSITLYLPRIFDKIKDNLECYIKNLAEEKHLES